MSAYRDPSKSKAAAAVSWHEVAHDASSSRCGILAPYGSEYQGYLGHRQFHQGSDAQHKDETREKFPGMIREELKPNSTPQALSRILRGLDARWKWSAVSHHSATRVAKFAPSAGRGETRSAEKHHETEGRL
jgi:hypothetical protein